MQKRTNRKGLNNTTLSQVSDAFFVTDDVNIFLSPFLHFSASLVGGWTPTISNITYNSFHVEWQQLTNQINYSVQAYVVIVNWTVGEEERMTGRILPSDASSVTIRRLPSFVDYEFVVIAVDDLGTPYNSSSASFRTLEGG